MAIIMKRKFLLVEPSTYDLKFVPNSCYFAKQTNFILILALLAEKNPTEILKQHFWIFSTLRTRQMVCLLIFILTKVYWPWPYLPKKSHRDIQTAFCKTNGKFAQLHFTINSQCGKYLIKVDLYLVWSYNFKYL